MGIAIRGEYPFQSNLSDNALSYLFINRYCYYSNVLFLLHGGLNGHTLLKRSKRPEMR